GVNPGDAGTRRDPSWAGVATPYVVGYELAGHVVETEEPVWALLPARTTRHGALAERVAVPVELLAPRPPQLAPIVAAALPLAGCTALQTLQRMPLVAGSWVLVHGASGGVGHLLVQMAVLRGYRVAAASRPGGRARLGGARRRLAAGRRCAPGGAGRRALARPLVAIRGGRRRASAGTPARGGRRSRRRTARALPAARRARRTRHQERAHG